MVAAFWLLSASLVAGAPTPGQDIQYQMNTRCDRDANVLRVWFKNTGRKTLTFKVTKVVWNEVPLKEKLPLTVNLKPGQVANLRFTPIHPGVAQYGEYFFVQTVELDGKSAVGGMAQGYEGGLLSTQASIGFKRVTSDGVPRDGDKWAVDFSRYPGAPPMEIRRLTLTKDGVKVKSTEEPWILQSGARATLATVQETRGLWVNRFEWRRTPWSPWHKAIQRETFKS